MADPIIRRRLRGSLLDLWWSYVDQGTPERFDPFRELLDHLDSMDGVADTTT